MGNAGGARRILRIVALIAILSMTGCVGSSLEQTPLPVDQSTTVQPPASHAPPAEAPSDASPDDDVPDSPNDQTSVPPTRSSTLKGVTVRYVCHQPAPAGHRECDAIIGASAGAARFARSSGCNRTVPYCASDLQAAYGLTQIARTGGKRAIVGIVDAYGYPNAASDLAVYRKSMGLPSCAASTGCLKIVNQGGHAGPLPKPNADSSDDWRLQEALDLDMVSAICPNCRIVLVQANSNKNADLAASVNAAVALGAVAVGNSYSGKEENARNAAYQHPGRAITASAGNGGLGARAPCSYAAVVCVGGTSLLATSSGRGWSERAWSDAGSGCSAYVAKPSWQHLKVCATRSEVDVSAVADPETGVAVYETAAGGWQQMGGTGVGAAMAAALFALGPSAARANAPKWIWRHGGSSSYHLALGIDGYDGPTGWGTPNGIGGF
jgi:hypothetical protein